MRSEGERGNVEKRKKKKPPTPPPTPTKNQSSWNAEVLMETGCGDKLITDPLVLLTEEGE